MEKTATQSSEEVIQVFQKYVIPNYGRYPICLVRGEGSYIWDAEGNRYLDLFPGWGCNILGHCPPAVVSPHMSQVRSTHRETNRARCGASPAAGVEEDVF